MEEEMVENKEWVLTAYAEEGLPTTQHLQLRTTRLPILSLEHIPEGHVSVQNLWLCVDPYMRTIMTGRNEGLCLPQFQLNQVVKTFGIGRVIKSKEKDYKEGDIVLNTECPIAEYSFMPTRLLRKLDATAGVDLVNYLSALGLAGFTAWVGIQVLGNPKPGENVFISAAAGGVGMYAGQLAKLKGCRVVGSTGTDDKVKFLKEELGFDDAFNYKKETDYNAALSKYFPDGIDIYLDNVGGKMLEAVLNHVNKRARIPLCGMISQYNQGLNQREKVGNLLNLVGKEVKMEGFLMSSYLNHFGDFTLEMEGYIKQGKISTKHEIYHGIESFLDSLASMFSGSNVGKIIIQL